MIYPSAVELAIEECIKDDILAEFLRKNRAEAKNVSIYEYDEEKHMGQLKEEGRQECLQEMVLRMKQHGLTIEEISELSGLTIEEIENM